jgi:hypothetical protein
MSAIGAKRTLDSRRANDRFWRIADIPGERQSRLATCPTKYPIAAQFGYGTASFGNGASMFDDFCLGRITALIGAVLIVIATGFTVIWYGLSSSAF